MISEDRLTQALRDAAGGVTAPEVDLSAVRAEARRTRIRAASAAALTTAVAVIVASTTLFGGRDPSASLPASSPLPSASTTTAQVGYTSTLYGFTIVPPPGWEVDAADRAWTWEADVRDWRSPAHDVFRSPGDDVLVSAWAVPLDPGTPLDSAADLEAWIEDYCQRSGESLCTGIADRAVALCPERRDCTSGLLVRFGDYSQAYFTGGRYGSDTMTIVAVWRPERDPTVRPYGGSRQLLERFLLPMGVTVPR